MGEKEPLEDKQISHAICGDCLAKMQIEVDQYFSKKELGK